MSRWVELTDVEREEVRQNVWKLVEENLGYIDDVTSEEKRRSIVTRVANALQRNGLFTKTDICELSEQELFKMRGLGGPRSKAIIRNIRSNYDELKEKQERLAEIDKTIQRLLEEKVMILKSLD